MYGVQGITDVGDIIWIIIRCEIFIDFIPIQQTKD